MSPLASLPLVGLLLAPASPVSLSAGGRLHWDAPRQCPSADAVGQMIDEHLGPRGDTAEGFTARVDVRTNDAGQWAVQIDGQTREGPFSRSLSAPSCDAAAQTAALAIALAVGPATADTEVPVAPPPAVPEPETPDPPAKPSDPEPIEPPPDATSNSTTEPSPAEPDATDPSPGSADAQAQPRRRPGVLFGAGAGVVGGHLPATGASLQGHVSLVGRRWQVTARAEHIVRRRVLLAGIDDAGGQISFTTGVVEAGPLFRPGPFELPVLAGVAAGAIAAQGFGSDADLEQTVPWATAVLGSGLRWAPVPRLALGLRAELSVALLRHTFTFGPTLPLLTTGLVAGRAWATVSFRIP